MDDKASCPAQNDPLLAPFLGAERDGEKLLATLISESAEPVIRGAIRQKLRVSFSHSDGSAQNQDALDLASEVRAAIIADLRNLKMNHGQRAIGDFRQYVAMKSYSACADYFREKHPQRWRLKNALRYQLKQNRGFAVQRDERGKWICDLSTRTGADSQLAGPVRESPDVISLFPEGTSHLQESTLAELLTTILDRAGGPLELDRLVATVAQVKGIQDYPAESYDHDKLLSESLSNPGPGIDAALEQRFYLAKLWAEVCNLPALQRSALLLNLRDANGDSAIMLLPYLGIASKDEIAEVAGVANERFDELWPELPLEDSTIAQLLGVTRQQVINLRKTARERLARRMKAMEKSSSQGGRGR